MNEHDYEPVLGLPAHLPEGETILWQGAPDWRTFARRAMRVRVVAGYFGLLMAWGAAAQLSSAALLSQVAVSTLRLGGLAIAAIALLTLFAWLVARTTVYTITSRRLVIRFGIALPITIQIAFKMIASAGVHRWSDGSGDIAITLLPSQRIAYLVMWPHTRPWKLAKTQPTLRGIPEVNTVVQILGRALAASASQPARSVPVPVAAASAAGGKIAVALT